MGPDPGGVSWGLAREGCCGAGLGGVPWGLAREGVP